ncbi:MAG: DUF5071 domain-containing protein [Bacteroidota bacterium]
MEIRNLIPKDKGDVETAQKLFSYTYEEIRSIVPDLLGWIQDMNWPVARPVSEYLESISEDITEEILVILQGDDDIWKYWRIHVFGLWSKKEIHLLLLKEIKRIAESPTESETKEEVQEVALELLQK